MQGYLLLVSLGVECGFWSLLVYSWVVQVDGLGK